MRLSEMLKVFVDDAPIVVVLDGKEVWQGLRRDVPDSLDAGMIAFDVMVADDVTVFCYSDDDLPF